MHLSKRTGPMKNASLSVPNSPNLPFERQEREWPERRMKYLGGPPKAPQKKKRNKSQLRRLYSSCDDLQLLTDLKTLSIQNKRVQILSTIKSKTFHRQCYTRCSLIGTGSFGVVCSVRSADPHSKYKGIELALKVSRTIRKKRHCGDEIEILKKLQKHTYHVNICKFLFYGLDAEGRLHQGFEYYPNGTLQQLIELQEEKLNVFQTLQLLIQINNGLLHIHSNDIVHLDLKPENIFIAKQNNGCICVKIGDFGISTLIKNRDQKTLKMCSGDPIYIAPEILDSLSNIHNISCQNIENIKKIDIFSLAIILVEVMYDVELPSQGPLFAYLRNIEKNQTIEWSKFGEEMHPNEINQLKLKYNVSKMLCKNPNDRVSSTQLWTEIQCLFEPFEIHTSLLELSKLEVPNRQQLQQLGNTFLDADDDCLKDTFEVFVDASISVEPNDLLSQLTDFTLVHTEQQLNNAFLLC
eukprot:117013_1